MKPRKKDQKGAEARWEKSQEGEFEGIIRLGKNGPQGKAETRWSKSEEEAPKKGKKTNKAESRWEKEQDENNNSR